MSPEWEKVGLSWTRRQFLKGILGASALVWMGKARVALGRSGPLPPLRLVFYTDVHAREEWETPRALRMVADAINGQKAQLAIAGGDLITEGFDRCPEDVAPRWDVYMENLHKRLDVRIEAAIGNHDLVGARPKDAGCRVEDPRREFKQRLGLESTWRSFEVGGYRFVILDAIRIRDDELAYEGWVCEEQLAELSRWVQEDEPLIVVTHIPLLTAFYQATEGGTAMAPANRIVLNAPRVIDVLARHQMVIVLQGHLHVNELLRWRGITFINGGAVCGKWWRGEWHGTKEGFGVLTVEEGHVNWEYIAYGWEARRPAGV